MIYVGAFWHTEHVNPDERVEMLFIHVMSCFVLLSFSLNIEVALIKPGKMT